MPGYKSKTQSKKNLKSSNKAKNGGRRRKQTMKKVRRGRKVMRGGAKDFSSDQLAKQLNIDGAMIPFLTRYFKVQDVVMDYPGFDDFEKHYNERFNQNKSETFGKFNSDELMQRLSLNEGQKEYDNDDTTKLRKSILTLAV